VNVAVPVLPDFSGEDLTAVLIRDCNLKSEVELADDLRARSSQIRRGVDRDFEATKAMLSRLPGLLIRPVIHLLGFVLYTLNLWHELMGVPKDAFGSAQVTSVEAFGIEEGYGPLDPYSRCPMMVVIGRLEQTARVIDGKLEIRPMIPICFTFDHRIIDGVGCARVMNSIRGRLETSAKVNGFFGGTGEVRARAPLPFRGVATRSEEPRT
jgi:pyruvate dehydrogenase E2 component (dihydrolipoamide acetyltransferase)